jgi:transposase
MEGHNMYLRQARNKKTGRTFMSIVHGYWDADAKQSRTKTVQKIGYLDDEEKKHTDPVAYYTAMVEAMEKERKTNTFININLDMDKLLERGIANRKNYGHIVYSKIYHELEIDRFLKNARRHMNFEFNTDAIMRLLVYSRLLSPGSKRAAILKKEQFFDSFKFSLDDVYNALTHFDEISGRLQQHLHESVAKQYGRETDLIYYDVTNYYFEIDMQDELRRKGAEKNNRKDPIVQMGLFLDKIGLPILYRLFSGNTHDSQTMMPMLTEIKTKYGANRIIAVADKALNNGDNIAFHTVLGDGYIYSKSIRGASDDFKKWVLDEAGYHKVPDRHKMKSKVVPDATIRVTVKQVGKKKIKKNENVEQKWIVYYSEKYAARARHKREEAIAKALDIIKCPIKYRQMFDYGAIGYIENIKIDKETREILNVEDKLILDVRKIEEEEKFDGYYAIVTSELDDDDDHIIETYKGLWRIEESFKITKSVFGTRPIFLRLHAHINAHFLTCFISLLIARIVELRLGCKYDIAKITETLRNIACSHIDQNLWLFDFADEVTDDINTAFGTDIGRKIMTLEKIKNNFGTTKKS